MNYLQQIPADHLEGSRQDDVSRTVMKRADRNSLTTAAKQSSSPGVGNSQRTVDKRDGPHGKSDTQQVVIELYTVALHKIVIVCMCFYSAYRLAQTCSKQTALFFFFS